jgi:DNA-binding beta-propeller fold protein YncE
MTVEIGEGDFRYSVSESWEKLPPGIAMGEVAAVAVGDDDRVYVFNRGEHPMIVFSREGEFIKSWGQGLFPHAHGLHMDKEQTLWLTDDQNHCVHRCTVDGEVLATIGVRGKPAPYMSCRPFCRCTHTAISPKGDLYVADGYWNPCVHQFSPDGKHIRSWGTSGTRPGEFNVVHNIVCDDDGWIYVADRENHRIQVFDSNGRYETQWNNLHRPCTLMLVGDHCIVGELPPTLPVNRKAPNLGPRFSVLDKSGNLVATMGDCIPGNGPGQFVAPHGLAMDSKGDLYVADVSHTSWPQSFPDTPMPSGLKSLFKLNHLPS